MGRIQQQVDSMSDNTRKSAADLLAGQKETETLRKKLSNLEERREAVKVPCSVSIIRKHPYLRLGLV